MPASTEYPHPGVEVLAAEECWRLLALGRVGRLAVSGDDGGPDVLPVNYLTHDGAIFFRTAPGASCAASRRTRRSPSRSTDRMTCTAGASSSAARRTR